jgi:hypothetical protein
MSGFLIVDNDVLSSLSQEAVNFNPTAMDALFIPNTTVVITSTVYGEATRFAGTHPNSTFRKVWLDENIAAGNIILEPTPLFPVGQSDAGEFSMIEVGITRYAGSSVTYVSNDQIFTDLSVAGVSAFNAIPGHTHNTGQGVLFKSLVEGGISTLEYQVSSYNLRDSSNEAVILDFGGTAVGSNGAIFTLTPGGLTIRQPDGTIVNPSPNERFLIDSSGNVEITGLFIPNVNGGQFIPKDEYCFLAGTMITMWPTDPSLKPNADGIYDKNEVLAKVWKKPIEDINPDDWVLSYDKQNNLQPGNVTRTFQNQSKHILDVFGLMVTPGHATLCGDGKFADKHVPIIDILRSDGALVNEDGSMIRANTGCKVGSYEDQFVQLAVGHIDDNGSLDLWNQGQVRIGARFITDDGRDVSIADMLKNAGAKVNADGKVESPGMDIATPLHLSFLAQMPQPEDYILKRSNLTLREIYEANEWEDAAR